MPVDEVDEVVDPIANAYRRASERIDARLLAVQSDPARFRQARRLREVSSAVDAELRVLDRRAAPAAARAVPFTHEMGFATGAIASGAQQVAWDLIDRDAVNHVARGLYTDLLEATSNVSRSTKRLLREIMNDELLAKLIEGDTAVNAGRRVRELANARGVYAVRYANGALHPLGEYAEMATRTITAEAYNGGVIDGAETRDVAWFEIFDGPDCGLSFHEDPTIADGLVVDKDTAATYQISHPNCRRSFGPRPDVRSADEAASAGRSTAQASRADQIRADMLRNRPMSERGISAAQPRVRGRAPSVSDPRGYRAARAVPEVESPLAVAMRSGVADEVTMAGGRQNIGISRVRFNDGTVAVRKRVADVAHGDTARTQISNEVLSARVARTMGIDYDVVKVNDNEILMTFVDGEVGTGRLKKKIAQGPQGVRKLSKSKQAAMQGESGERTALFDWLTENQDRHSGNWIHTPDDQIIPIDNARSLSSARVAPTENLNVSPFVVANAESLGLRASNYGVSWADDAVSVWSPNDMATLRERLMGTRQSFIAEGQSDSFDRMMQRLDEVAARAAGTEDRL